MQKLFILSPFCSDASSTWMSPGRSRKLHQLSDLVVNCNFSPLLYNTCPIKYLPLDSSLRVIQCCRYNFWLLRFVELFFNGCIASYSLRNANVLRFVIYNSRLAEFIFFFPILMVNRRKIKLCIQFEDLPSARLSKSGIRGRLDKFVTQFLLDRANCATAVSETVKHTLLKQYRFHSSRVIIFPPLVDPAYLNLISKRKPPFSNSSIAIMYAGGYGPEKGVQTLIDAFINLNSSNFTLHLYGPVPEELRKMYSSVKNMFIHGQVALNDLYFAYSQADIVVNPHQVIKNASHIFPFKIIEILASGCLPLLTRMPGLELFDVPAVCFFNDSTSLTDKLLKSSALFQANSSSLRKTFDIVNISHNPVIFKNYFKEFWVRCSYI